jgi:hypothetical protein
MSGTFKSPTSDIQEIADIMLVASESESYVSRKMAILAALLEQRIPRLTSNESRRPGSVKGTIDHAVVKYLSNYSPELEKVSPVPLAVDGDGNCLDNSTLFEVEGNWSNAFCFRVRKGLHFVQNLAVYRNALMSETVSNINSEEDLVYFADKYFVNTEWQSPFHDLPTAHLLNRRIVIWYPIVRAPIL